MSVCFGIGQGAGVMAAKTVQSGCFVRNVDIKAVQQELMRQGIPDHN